MVHDESVSNVILVDRLCVHCTSFQVQNILYIDKYIYVHCVHNRTVFIFFISVHIFYKTIQDHVSLYQNIKIKYEEIESKIATAEGKIFPHMYIHCREKHSV